MTFRLWRARLVSIYSNQGPTHPGSYEYTLKTADNDTFSFVGLDMCPRPGAGRPFNFLGHISEVGNNIRVESSSSIHRCSSLLQAEMKSIRTLSERTRSSNSTIFFGHYPLSFTYSKGLEELMNHGIVYLNGHLHSGIKHLYARHSNGLLELELGDWKDNRRWRRSILFLHPFQRFLLFSSDSVWSQSTRVYCPSMIFDSINRSMPSFQIPKQPNSKHHENRSIGSVRVLTSGEFSPQMRIRASRRLCSIRVVIFSPLPIVDVRVTIDSKFVGQAVQSVDTAHLYVLPWNASLYHDGQLHQISVTIRVTLTANDCWSLRRTFRSRMQTIIRSLVNMNSRWLHRPSRRGLTRNSFSWSIGQLL